MSLPISALSDEELIHYASIDEGAKQELARRLSGDEGLGLLDAMADMEAELAEYKRKEDSDSSSCCFCNTDESDCISRVDSLLRGYEEMDLDSLRAAVRSAKEEMLDFV